MTSALHHFVVTAAEGGHHPVVNELPFAPIWFGVIALGSLLALLGLLWSFRNTLALEPHATADPHGAGAHGHGTTTH
ncbi:MAG: hypothetical protein Q4P07_06370 [Ornithinimicrobium sp.]|uniref:hypothetical protein n=1 Tax=Ornithinimicrobium sp. TaxID=1977084 RepID=UPI0026DF1967|nr:hypothetical protein [Ornithinimicrobium sp.]MDO5739757.1 hypothetical protein [Ornithinimicrobium sp.]